MRKLLYLLSGAVLMGAAACSDQGDVVDAIIDGVEKAPVVKSFPYTLVTADYGTISGAATAAAGDNTENKAQAAAVKSQNALNDFAAADVYVPAVLAAKFPTLGLGSVIQVTYDFEGAKAEYLSRLSESPSYVYASEDFEGYTQTSNPYGKWDQNGWSHVDTQGDGSKYWQSRIYSGNKYAQMSANSGVNEVTENYVISPALTINRPTGNSFMFDLCVGYWNFAGLKVLIAEESATIVTDPANAAWTDVSASFTIPTEPTGTYGSWATAGSLNIDNYAGKTIRVAFKYNGRKGITGESNQTTTFQIDNVKVVNGDPSIVPQPGDVYINDNGAWSKYADGISLTAADYASMGVTSLNATTAPGYLPKFLAAKFQYAQEGAKKAVLYGSNADEYTLTGGVWGPTVTRGTITSQFIYGTKGWMFDPTVSHTMVDADYQIMFNYVKDNADLSSYVDTYTTSTWRSEYYFGFSGYYKNVSFRLSYRTSYTQDTELVSLPDDAAKAKLLWKRLIEKGMPIYLSLKYPAATAQVQGVDVPYVTTVAVYYPDCVTSGTIYPVLTYKVAKDGTGSSPATFEYVSGAPAEYYP